MNEMWKALEAYQPYAERHGFGPEWMKMTTERTDDAASDASDAAAEAEAWAARVAAWAATAARAAWAAWAILHINEAIKREETT